MRRKRLLNAGNKSIFKVLLPWAVVVSVLAIGVVATVIVFADVDDPRLRVDSGPTNCTVSGNNMTCSFSNRFSIINGVAGESYPYRWEINPLSAFDGTPTTPTSGSISATGHFVIGITLTFPQDSCANIGYDLHVLDNYDHPTNSYTGGRSTMGNGCDGPPADVPPADVPPALPPGDPVLDPTPRLPSEDRNDDPMPVSEQPNDSNNKLVAPISLQTTPDANKVIAASPQGLQSPPPPAKQEPSAFYDGKQYEPGIVDKSFESTALAIDVSNSTQRVIIFATIAVIVAITTRVLLVRFRRKSR